MTKFAVERSEARERKRELFKVYANRRGKTDSMPGVQQSLTKAPAPQTTYIHTSPDANRLLEEKIEELREQGLLPTDEG